MRTRIVRVERDQLAFDGKQGRQVAIDRVDACGAETISERASELISFLRYPPGVKCLSRGRPAS
jgi:hypothetical protein